MQPKSLTKRLQLLVAILFLALAAFISRQFGPTRLTTIGATTEVTELTSGLTLPARVDTGAQFCSIHCEEIEITDSRADPRENVGKPVRFRIANPAGQSAWIESTLVDHAAIRSANHTADRYFVELPIRVAGVDGKVVEARVLVNLHNRSTMRYPFLIGRNLLRDRFLVDVRQQNSDDVLW
jgi:hypothetical protein